MIECRGYKCCIFSYPIRWTDEERTTVQSTIDIVGESNLQSFGTLMLTNGHDFLAKYPQNTLDKFREYLQSQASQVPELERFFGLFDGHVILLDTELENQALNRPQLEQFFNGVGPNMFKVNGNHHEEDEYGCWPFNCSAI